MQQIQRVQSPVALLEHKPEICACICTHNGQATLRDCLDSLASQNLQSERFSILLVDDGSTDETANTFRQWRDEHPRLTARLVCQPHGGASAARNAGLQLSDASLVAFIDDDATAEPGWLSGLLAAFAEFPGAAAAGGPVQVQWASDKPRWWHDKLDEAFNRFEPGDQPRTLGFPCLPRGCNFAVRRNVAVGLGRFRTDLGRHKARLLGGDQLELFLRMLATDYQVVYWPEARVQHRAVTERATRRHVLCRAWMHGRSLARLAHAYPAVAHAAVGVCRCTCPSQGTSLLHRFGLAGCKSLLFRLGYHWERFKLGRGLTRQRVVQALPCLSRA